MYIPRPACHLCRRLLFLSSLVKINPVISLFHIRLPRQLDPPATLCPAERMDLFIMDGRYILCPGYHFFQHLTQNFIPYHLFFLQKTVGIQTVSVVFLPHQSAGRFSSLLFYIETPLFLPLCHGRNMSCCLGVNVFRYHRQYLPAQYISAVFKTAVGRILTVRQLLFSQIRFNFLPADK